MYIDRSIRPGAKREAAEGGEAWRPFIYFDHVSPYCYLAQTQLAKLGLDIDCRPTTAIDAFEAEDDAIFIKPEAIADEIWQGARQDRSGWSFNVAVRPFSESW